MKLFTLELTKTVVIEIEAANYRDAVRLVSEGGVEDLSSRFDSAKARAALVMEEEAALVSEFGPRG